MKVDLMRNIDRYVGIPLVFILTVFVKIASLFHRTARSKPENILFIELSEMGSTILADPAMRKARSEFGAELFFCIFSKNRESLELLNTIKESNIFLIRSENLFTFLWDSARFFLWTRKRNIDTVVDLELFSRCTAILTGLSGAERKVGFHSFYSEGLYRGDIFTHKVSYNPHMHIAKNFISLVNSLILEKAQVPYSKTRIKDEEITLTKIDPSDESKGKVLERVKKEYPVYDEGKNHIVLINPNVGDILPQRKWPLYRFSGVIKKILEHDNETVVLVTGSDDDRDEMRRLVDMLGNERCINFTGKVKIRELPALYSLSSFMLTNDSGPAHFSAITDMPSFVIFGPETPELYGSLGNSTPIYARLACSPCVTAANHRKTPCKDNQCLKVISEEEVFDIIKKHLR